MEKSAFVRTTSAEKIMVTSLKVCPLVSPNVDVYITMSESFGNFTMRMKMDYDY